VRLVDPPERTEGLANEAVKLIEYRTRAVGLIIRLTAFHRPDENSGAGEMFEVPLHGSRAKAGTDGGPSGVFDLPLDQ
jgi:hypothetical protein